MSSAATASSAKFAVNSGSTAVDNDVLKHYTTLKDEIFNDETKTLAYWRLKNAEVEHALTDFCLWEEPTNADEAFEQTLALFENLNQSFAYQEEENDNFPFFNKPFFVDQNQIPIVIGGKPASPPKSISEMLVKILADNCSSVYTVSRSKVSSERLLHFDTQGLDEKDGIQNFSEIFSRISDTYHPPKSENRTHALFFTLGSHKGQNAFRRNLQSAHNLALALQNSKDFKWTQIVVTGTDATLPSDHMKENVICSDGTMLTIPSYKISEYNFVYAMSKLGQFLILAEAVAKLTENISLPVEYMAFLKQKIPRIWANVMEAGDNAMYQIEKENDEAYISMKELDIISTRFTKDILPLLKDNFRIASDISICFTPLHAKPWSEICITQKSPKCYILEQILRRLKNAISIQQAARYHLTE